MANSRRNTFKCDVLDCTKTFNERVDLVKHQKDYHQLEFERCEECNGKEFRRDRIMDHFSGCHSMEDMSCPWTCKDKSFNGRTGFLYHNYTFHRAEMGYISIQPGQEPERLAFRVVEGAELLDKLIEFKIPIKYNRLNKASFVIDFDENIRMARWTAYCLERTIQVPKLKSRLGMKFSKDDTTGMKQLTSGGFESMRHFVKGHLVPAGDMRCHVKGLEQCFLMTNIVPMEDSINIGVWLALENHTRKLMLFWDNITVISGPVFTGVPNQQKVAGSYYVKFPTSFFKILILQRLGFPQIMVQCFLIPNQQTRESFLRFRTTLDQIRSLTGINFLQEVDCHSTWDPDMIDISMTCKSCPKRFMSKDMLNQHEWIVHPIPTHRCNLCPEIFTDKGVYIAHRKIHNVHMCSECGKGFSSPGDLERHLRSHSKEKPFTCDTCGNSYGWLSLLKMHMDKHLDEKRYECLDCKTKFTYQHSLNEHKQRCTGTPTVRSQPDRSMMPHPCSFCGKRFQTIYHRRRHEESCNPSKSDTPNIKSLADRSMLPYACSKCGKRFRTGSHRNRHSESCKVSGDSDNFDLKRKSTDRSHKEDKDDPAKKSKFFPLFNFASSKKNN